MQIIARRQKLGAKSGEIPSVNRLSVYSLAFGNGWNQGLSMSLSAKHLELLPEKQDQEI
jgi:hypothetical protein